MENTTKIDNFIVNINKQFDNSVIAENKKRGVTSNVTLNHGIQQHNLQQEVGFRIWNLDKSSILLYLLNKSVTWTLPVIKTVSDHNTLNDTFILLEQFIDSDFHSAVCIVNTKDLVPIQLPNQTTFTNISFQYMIYDVIIDLCSVNKIKTPDNVRFSHFIKIEEINKLSFKTPILNHLMDYIKRVET